MAVCTTLPAKAFPTPRCKCGSRTKPATTICKSTILPRWICAAPSQTDADGRFYLRTIAPLGYMIPMDGPVGDMIRAQKRHGYRPAHIHFIIGAEGYREVVTALYLQGDEHIDSDTVFGVTASLVTEVEQQRSRFADSESAHHQVRFPTPCRGGIRLGTRGRRSFADRAESRQLSRPA